MPRLVANQCGIITVSLPPVPFVPSLVTRQCPPQTAIKILGVWGEGPSNAPKNKKAEYLPKLGSNSSQKVHQILTNSVPTERRNKNVLEKRFFM